ncbi:hypothetical protein LguiB_013649 [Lonicera macranthoides]
MESLWSADQSPKLADRFTSPKLCTDLTCFKGRAPPILSIWLEVGHSFLGVRPKTILVNYCEALLSRGCLVSVRPRNADLEYAWIVARITTIMAQSLCDERILNCAIGNLFNNGIWFACDECSIDPSLEETEVEEEWRYEEENEEESKKETKIREDNEEIEADDANYQLQMMRCLR